ncbi:hypothetical protein SISNIDRAFT_488684 [Sistotremastrum niveocremeum HHB9708]|uniref:Autophagy-related protein 27 n=1 Tax=Sistotremastrum niveocremeum HHB9708 TaxID=1314777 RepID=A0A164R0X7_9AGAM|nr:hypothetical protein SISNIDRAFT_488684 [Sistotremastrum niveocremeum HHB9708]
MRNSRRTASISGVVVALLIASGSAQSADKPPHQSCSFSLAAPDGSTRHYNLCPLVDLEDDKTLIQEYHAEAEDGHGDMYTTVEWRFDLKGKRPYKTNVSGECPPHTALCFHDSTYYLADDYASPVFQSGRVFPLLSAADRPVRPSPEDEPIVDFGQSTRLVSPESGSPHLLTRLQGGYHMDYPTTTEIEFLCDPTAEESALSFLYPEPLLVDSEDGPHWISNFQWRSKYACATHIDRPESIDTISFAIMEAEADEGDNDLVASPPPPLQHKRFVWVFGPLVAITVLGLLYAARKPSFRTPSYTLPSFTNPNRLRFRPAPNSLLRWTLEADPSSSQRKTQARPFWGEIELDGEGAYEEVGLIPSPTPYSSRFHGHSAGYGATANAAPPRT